MRIVVKVGTSTLAHATGRLNIQRMERLCKVLSDLKNAGHEIILVSSGAIGMGVGKLNLSGRPADMPGKQAAAAVGQCELMFAYDKFFGEYHQNVAQVLLTADVPSQPISRRNVENTFRELLDMNVIPIVNENDTVAVDELEGRNFGDNDTLSAVVARMCEADLLVIFSDIDGLYDSDPRKNPQAKLISHVPVITSKVRKMAGGAGSSLGTGGMATKIGAAELCMDANIPMLVANGDKQGLLYDIVDGKQVGTLFSRNNE